MIAHTQMFDKPDVICPFAADGVCRGDCPSQRERACINGEDD